MMVICKAKMPKTKLNCVAETKNLYVNKDFNNNQKEKEKETQ